MVASVFSMAKLLEILILLFNPLSTLDTNMYFIVTFRSALCITWLLFKIVIQLKIFKTFKSNSDVIQFITT